MFWKNASLRVLCSVAFLFSGLATSNAASPGYGQSQSGLTKTSLACESSKRVWNLSVAVDQNYSVTARALTVHNASGPKAHVFSPPEDVLRAFGDSVYVPEFVTVATELLPQGPDTGVTQARVHVTEDGETQSFDVEFTSPPKPSAGPNVSQTAPVLRV